MKKIILTSAIIFATVAGVFAQAADQATLNIKLYAIQAITVNPTNKIVNLEYSTTDNYSKGVSEKQTNHLNVYSTGGFVVSVKSELDKLTTGGQTIEASGISVIASDGTENNLGLTNYSEVSLGTTPKTFITSTKGGINENFNVTYKAAGNNAYINNFFKGVNSTDAAVYTTTVTYSIVPN